MKECEFTFQVTFLVCCHPEILLPRQRDVTTSSLLLLLVPISKQNKITGKNSHILIRVVVGLYCGNPRHHRVVILSLKRNTHKKRDFKKYYYKVSSVPVHIFCWKSATTILRFHFQTLFNCKL